MLADRLKATLVVSWLLISTALLPVLLAPVVVSPQLLAAMAPVCESQVKTGRECTLCAAVSGSLLLYEGRLNAAVRRSPISVLLIAALFWNEFLAMAYTTRELHWFWIEVRRARQRTRTEEYSCRS